MSAALTYKDLWWVRSLLCRYFERHLESVVPRRFHPGGKGIELSNPGQFDTQ